MRHVTALAPEVVCRAAEYASRHPRTPLSLLLRSSADVSEMLGRAERFWPTFSTSTQLEVRRESERIETVLHPTRGAPEGWLPLFAPYVFVGLATSIRSGTREAAMITEARVPEPVCALEEVLEAPVEVTAGCPRLVLPIAAGRARIVSHDPIVAGFLERELEHQLQSVCGALTVEVDRCLRVRLEDGLTMQEVAKGFGMSERTLRRRLEDEGTSFRERLDRVRELRALELMQTHQVQEIATLVGFQDARAFQRAFRRWTGKSPTELRSQTLAVGK
jgi:AraC-like DNA-binding protein